VPNPDIQHLLMAPGIGKISAFTLYLEIDGIELLRRRQALLLLLPISPRRQQFQSKTQTQIRNKDGNKYLELAFSEIAIHVIPKSSDSTTPKPENLPGPSPEPLSPRNGPNRIPHAQRPYGIQNFQRPDAQQNEKTWMAASLKPARITGNRPTDEGDQLDWEKRRDAMIYLESHTNVCSIRLRRR
jgi:hypothetical protein